MCGSAPTELKDEMDSKKPEDTDFRQQRLRAWQPLLTPFWVIMTFLIIGVIFIPIGIYIFTSSNSVVEIDVRYDNLPQLPTISNGKRNSGVINIPITSAMSKPVFVYYKLVNFYQNHRRYVKSRSDVQLKAASESDASTVSTCDPLMYNGVTATGASVGLYPCGLIANSFFNDTFNATYISPAGIVSPLVPFSADWDKSDIAWSSDVSSKFSDLYAGKQLPSTLTRTSTQGYTLPNINDPDFIVWMRNAGLPTFRKLYRKINRDLEAGSTLSVYVGNNFPVADFGGEKHIVLSTSSWLGGKNFFLAYAYIVIGAICFFFAIVFAVKHYMCGRPLGDMKYFNFSIAGKK